MEEVEGTPVSARTIESADFDRVTHDSLLSKCRSVFDGKNADIGRDREKKKAIEFDKSCVEEAGRNFEIVSEIKILEGREEVIIEDPNDEQCGESWLLKQGRGLILIFKNRKKRCLVLFAITNTLKNSRGD